MLRWQTAVVLSAFTAVIALPSTSASARRGRDASMVKLLQSEVEMLRTTLEKSVEDVRALSTQTQESKQTQAELAARVAALAAQQDRLAELETRLATLEAQEDPNELLRVDAQLWIRPEYVDNLQDFDEASGDEDLFFRQRLRLGATLQPVDWLRLRTVLQNSTVWGTEYTGNTGTKNRLGFFEAYVDIQIPGVEGLRIKGGRLAMRYGSERLIGDDDWRQQPRSFDGGVISYTYGDIIQADLFGAVVRERSTPIGQDRNLFGLYLTTHALEGYAFDLYALFLDDGNPTDERQIASIGVRASGEPIAGLTFDAEAVVQVGKVRPQGGPQLDHLATAYFVGVDYTIPVFGAPSIGAFFSTASGDANPYDGRSVDFDPLFPSKHLYWGAMDLFSWTNIIDYGGRVGFAPLTGMKIGVEAHRFQAVEARGSVPGLWGKQRALDATDSALGTEVDLVFSYRFNSLLSLTTGYSLFLPDKNVDQVLHTSDRADWAFLQVQVDI